MVITLKLIQNFKPITVCSLVMNVFFSLSIEWNSIRLGGPACGIVTKTVAKLCQGVVGWGIQGVVRVQGVVGVGYRGGGSRGGPRFHSIDRLPKLWLLHCF